MYTFYFFGIQIIQNSETEINQDTPEIIDEIYFYEKLTFMKNNIDAFVDDNFSLLFVIKNNLLFLAASINEINIAVSFIQIPNPTNIINMEIIFILIIFCVTIINLRFD